MARGVKAATAAGPVEGPWALPDGWRWERLAPFVTSRGTVDPLKRPNDEFCLYSVPAFPSRQPERVSGRDIGSTKQAVASGDLLLCKINPRINRVWKVGETFGLPTIASTEWIVISTGEELETDYLRHFLTTAWVTDYLAQNASGVGGSLMRVRPNTAGEITVPIPPRDLQAKIATRIDTLFAEVAAGEEALAAARASLGQWRQALLKAAVTGDLTADWRAANPPAETGEALLTRILADRRTRWTQDPRNKGKRYHEPPPTDTTDLPTLPDGWAWASFDQLITGLRNGHSAKPQATPPGTPILRISAVRPMKVYVDDLRWLAPEIDPGAAMTKSGDLLFTRYNGSPDLVGVCGRFTYDQPVAYPDKLMAAQPVHQDEVVGGYLELACNAGESRRFIEQNTKTTAGQHGVSGETIKAVPIPVPPKEEMAEIMRQVQLALTEQTTAAYDVIGFSDGAASLRQSILAAAFRGELAA